ncbi:hypothetical protein [Actinomycetospora succinea]|uniref:hypothetical protein n=1 Tax=Actinomycetospora succinea TaxID=663603 RepID=UPI00105DA282|nr:hypothetical protein [Actinomycetospora succinea]
MQVIGLRGELADLRAHSKLGCEHVADTVGELLDRAVCAARRRGPFRALANWWSGSNVEAAFRAMHRAEAEIARLYDEDRIRAAAPEALDRLRVCATDDRHRIEWERHLAAQNGRLTAAELSKVIQLGHEAKDQRYAKVRRFRNIVLSAAALITVFLALFAVIVSRAPDAVPLCFTAPPDTVLDCPTSSGRGASGGDVWIVMLLGMLGGSLAAAVSVRNIRGAPTPYNLATALALLKVPAGALTAVGALLLISGEVVPGLAPLASQEQILCYALVFGYAQQALTTLIDKKAGDLVTGVRDKGGDEGKPTR